MKKNLLRLRLPSPTELGFPHDALPSRDFSPWEKTYCWEDYHAEMSLLFPIAYFLEYRLGRMWRRAQRQIRDAWWKMVKYRFFPKHRHHVLSLQDPHSLYPYRVGYQDPLHKVLVASFNILVQFVEQERPDLKKPPGAAGEEHQPWAEAQQEIHALYVWWTQGRKNMQQEIEDRTKVWSDAYHAAATQEEAPSSSDDEMTSQGYEEKVEDEYLHRLINVRQFLWN